MSRKIESTEKFNAGLKKIKKKHKDFSEEEFANLLAQNGPTSNCHRITEEKTTPIYKARAAIGNSGKRGGARIIYGITESHLFLLDIYEKSQVSTILNGEARAQEAWSF